jgi:Domain of unknown function (DUF4189)
MVRSGRHSHAILTSVAGRAGPVHAVDVSLSGLNPAPASKMDTESMKRLGRSAFLRWMLAGAATVAGCGYPIDPDSWVPDFGIHGENGAIAVNYADSIGALAARYLNQAEADSRALELCGNGCEIALRFQGAGQCGAVARSEDGKIGVASGKPQASADAAAIENCRQEGGMNCVVRLQGCNE